MSPPPPSCETKRRSQGKGKKTKTETKEKDDHEYEARFLQWDEEAVLQRARYAGASSDRPRRVLLWNSIYVFPGGDDPRIARVRRSISQDGVETTIMTVKMPGKGGYERESETQVSDGEQAEHMLEMLGLVRKHATQKFRDVLEVPGLGRLDMDHHPGLPPILEVEAPTEAKLKRLLAALGLHPYSSPSSPSPAPYPPSSCPSSSSFPPSNKKEKEPLCSNPSLLPEVLYYKYYGVPLTRKPEGDMTFSRPSNIPRYFTKNRAMFMRILARQKEEARYISTMMKNRYTCEMERKRGTRCHLHCEGRDATQ